MEVDVAIVEIGVKRRFDQDFSYNQFIRNYLIILTAHIWLQPHQPEQPLRINIRLA
jgi:hypothetical protein